MYFICFCDFLAKLFRSLCNNFYPNCDDNHLLTIFSSIFCSDNILQKNPIRSKIFIPELILEQLDLIVILL